jgi:hypothetical protein
MPTPTYTALANITLGSNAGSVSFANIPQTFRDLVLIFDGTTTVAGNLYAQLNLDNTSSYSRQMIRGSGSAVAASSTTSNLIEVTNQGIQIGTRALATMNIFDYSATNKHKNLLMRGNYNFVDATTTRWAKTAGINRIVLTASFASGSTFALYGIVA